MELRNAPLLATKRDQALFVDREEIVRHLFDSAHAGLNTVLLGPRGVGKTSVLHRVLARAEEHQDDPRDVPWLPVAVTGEPTSAYDFLLRVLVALAEAMDQEGVAFDRQPLDRVLRPTRGEMFDDESTVGLLSLLRALDELATHLREAGRTPVFLVDELADSTVGRAVFGRMRDELWRVGGTWIVASDGAQRDALLQAPADVFFERTVEIGPLNPAASRALLRARLEHGQPDSHATLDDDTIDRVVRLSGGVPLSLVSLLRDVLDGVSLEETEAREREFSMQITTLSEPAQRLAAALRARGGLGRATDEELQWKMGWSASRLRQVFGELERAGIIDAVASSTNQPGRPSKVYRLRSPT